MFEMFQPAVHKWKTNKQVKKKNKQTNEQTNKQNKTEQIQPQLFILLISSDKLQFVT